MAKQILVNYMIKRCQSYVVLFCSQLARVQFRYPDGRSKTKIFPAEAPLQEVYDFANEEVAATFGRDNFTLSTTYPARQLDKVIITFTSGKSLELLSLFELISLAIVSAEIEMMNNKCHRFVFVFF